MFFVDSRKRIELYVLLSTSSDFISDSQIAFMQQLLAYEPRFRITAVKIDSSKLLNWTRFTSKIPEVINGLEITYLKFSQFKKRMNKSNAYCMLTTPYIELYDSSVRSILPQIKVLHLNYGLSNIMDWKSGEFELESFRFVDLFLTSSKFENIGFLESGIKSDRILCIGDPLIYDLLNTRRINRPGVTVTWAPHWTKNFYDQEGWSNWFLQIREILDFAIRFPTIRHIFRPHPLFFLNGFEWNEKLPDYAKEMWAVGFENEIELLHKYLSLPNVILSNSDLKTDLLQTDILITDGISILGYGLASGCIVGLSRRSSSPKLGEAGVEFLPFCHLINVENSETYDFLTLSISKAEINDSEPQKVFISQMYLIDNEPPGLRFVDSLKLS